MKPLKDFKIFVADDDMFFLNMFQFHLTALGYNDISIFTNGIDCLLKLEEKPDVIFLDHQMDTYTGYDVLKKIKRHDPNIYVVMVSAQQDVKTAVDALKHGAFDYIQKGDAESRKIKAVLNKIYEVRQLLAQSKPSLLSKILQRF